MEKEVRRVAAEEARAAWGSRDRHRITGKDNEQTEGMKATKQGHVAQPWVLATHHRILLMSAKKRQNRKGKISCMRVPLEK